MSHQIQKGVICLRIKKVTPILKALFALYEQTDLSDGGTEWILRLKPENRDLDDYWQPVHAALENLCEEYGCRPEEKVRVDLLLISLGYHLSQPTKEKKKSTYSISFPRVLNLVHKTSFKPSLYLEDLFNLACVFDDGHGLQSIEAGIVEYRDQNSNPIHYRGEGQFITKNLAYWQASSHGLEGGRRLDAALTRNDLNEAANHIVSGVNFILAGVKNPSQREQLRKLIAETLSASAE